jgi:two-component system cell cycle response regulator DivK
MSPADDEQRSIERTRGYVFPGNMPPELETAFDVAFSTLPSYSQPRNGSPGTGFVPANPAVMRDLALAVATFVAQLKRAGEPPQNVLIALKTMMRQRTHRTSLDFGVFEELQRLVVLSAVKAYFAEIDPRAVPDHVLPYDAEGDIQSGAKSPVQPTGPLVLVADDDEDARYLLQRHLTSQGYEVVIVRDSRDVMTVAARLRPALVLLDIAMPYLGGIALVQLLKSDPATSRIPVIAVTGVQIITDSPDLVSTGFDDVILKPVRRFELLRTIQTRLNAA